jgi:hypothetical protein
VGLTERVVLCMSRVPSRVSSEAIARVTAAGERPSFHAAPEKLRVSTTATNTAMASSRSMAFRPPQ